MTKPAWHSTWTRMRGNAANRSWLTTADVVDAVMAMGLEVSRWRVALIVRSMPRPASRYGMNQFTHEHVAAVVAAVEERQARR